MVTANSSTPENEKNLQFAAGNPEGAAAREIIPTEKTDKNPWTRRGIAAIVGAGVLGVGFYGFGFLKTKGEIDAANTLHNSDQKQSSLSAAETPGLPGDTNHDGAYSDAELQAMSPSAVANINPSLLVPVYGPGLDSYRQKTYDNMVKSNNFTPEQLDTIKVPTGDKAHYSDQDVLNEVTLDVIDASTQSDTTDGERILALPYNKNMREIAADISAIEFNQGKTLKRPLINAYKQVGVPIQQPHGSFNGVDIPSSIYIQARVIQQELLPNTPSEAPLTAYGLYALVEKDGAQEWTQLAYWTMEDATLAQSLNNLTQHQ